MTPLNTNKSLSDIFNIELTNTDKPLEALKIEAKAESIDSLEAQRVYVKQNMVKLIEKGMKSLDKIDEIATASELANDFKAVIAMIKVISDTNVALLECEVIQNKPLPLSNEFNQKTTNNNVFVGSTSELLKYIKTPDANSLNIIDEKND